MKLLFIATLLLAGCATPPPICEPAAPAAEEMTMPDGTPACMEVDEDGHCLDGAPPIPETLEEL